MLRFEKLVGEDERSDYDNGAKNGPKPEIACSEIIVAVPCGQFGSYSVGDSVRPHDRRDAERQPREDERDEKIMHCMLPVTWSRHDVYLFGDVGHQHQWVYSKGD